MACGMGSSQLHGRYAPSCERCSSHLRATVKREEGPSDKGTVKAVQSGWIHEEQVKVARRRMVPPVSTLENPPGDDQAGSAWMLPEMQEALACTKSYEVQFNTCAYQTKLKERWYKPAQWGRP